jgi:hypothetical protein
MMLLLVIFGLVGVSVTLGVIAVIGVLTNKIALLRRELRAPARPRSEIRHDIISNAVLLLLIVLLFLFLAGIVIIIGAGIGARPIGPF